MPYNYLFSLSIELIINIAHNLSAHDLIQFRQTSKAFYTDLELTRLTYLKLQEETFMRMSGGTLFWCSAGRLYIRGYNIGLDDTISECHTFTQVPLPFSESDGIRDIVFGPNGTFLLTCTGQVYASGENRFGDLGLGELAVCSSFQVVPIPLLPGDKVVKIAVGSISDTVTLFLTQVGQVFVCGSSSYGALGLGNEIKKCFSPTLSPFLPKTASDNIIDVHISCHNAIFLSSQGQVFGCGRNNRGALGLGDTLPRFFPTLISLPLRPDDKVKNIFHNQLSLLVLTTQGRVFACGSDETGALGLGPDLFNAPYLTEVSFLALLQPGDKFQRILKTRPSFFLTQAGHIYACGDNRDSQLGCVSDTRLRVGNHWILATTQPQQVQLPLGIDDKVVSVSINADCTTFLLTQQGHVFTAGVPIGSRRQNTQERVSRFIPFTLPGLAEGDYVVQCDTDGEKTYFLTHKRQAYAYGNNETGILGISETERVNFPQLISTLPLHPLLKC